MNKIVLLTDAIPDLGLLDRSPSARNYDLASELFHRVNRVIPQTQSVLEIAPSCRVRDAVALMRKHGYSQVPVVDNGEVLGVFSFRSFAHEVATATLNDWTNHKCAPGDLPVDEFLEQFEFARVTEEMSSVFDAMDRDNGVLIGTPERLVGILTPMDFLRYRYTVASPFVTVSEIELALRSLIRRALTSDELAAAAKRALASIYRDEDKIPTSLEEMSFDNYHSIVSRAETWDKFESVFGGTRSRTGAKLKEIGTIRNSLFHFKREITAEEHQRLASHRNWLLSKIKQADANRKAEALS